MRQRLATTALIGAQLALLGLVANEFRLENRAFLELLVYTAVGFLVHSLLAERFQRGAFLALSLGALYLVFGPANASWLLGLGCGFVALARLGPGWPRITALLAATLVLAWLRASGAAVPWSPAVWPVLASLFMFRLPIYLHHARHLKSRPPLTETLSYFFLLPNYCFPLFPVVDFRSFLEGRLGEAARTVYQRGVFWMARGVTHLLLYRVVYQKIVIGEDGVSDLGSLIRYMVGAFFLYLRVSGHFHLAIGILLLFGFNLPATHRRYFLASSFTDLWRRINIYWKEFMMRVIYYPVYFRARNLGPVGAVTAATIAVFVGTWLLHAYQWFWLLGTNPLTWQDATFWAVLCALLLGETLWTAANPRTTRTTRATRMLSRAATFGTMAVLWSFWSATSVAHWLSAWRAAGPAAAAVPGLVIACAGASLMLRRRSGKERATAQESYVPRLAASSVGVLALLLGLLALSRPAVHARLGRLTAELVTAASTRTLSARDLGRLERGYYENLGSARQNPELWELYARRPLDWKQVGETDLIEPTGDLLGTRLAADREAVFKGLPFRTNSFGMRDREYDLDKPPGTYRIALLGASHSVGGGVPPERTYEEILERRLMSGDRPFERYEVLNFSVPGRWLLKQAIALETWVVPFAPDAAILVSHPGDELRVVGELHDLLASRRFIPYPELRRIAAAADVDAETVEAIAEHRLAPFGPQLLEWAYRHFVETCRAQGTLPIWLRLPLPQRTEHGGDEQAAEPARAAGFLIVSLAHAYAGEPVREIQLAAWDTHPSAHAHALIADALYAALLEHRDAIPIAESRDQ